jgi:O-antigen/teichoic acid export membrane protein
MDRNDAGLKQRAVLSVPWAAAANGGVAVLHIVESIILARLLTPSDFGVIALAWAVIGLVRCWADVGISNALIHHQESTDEELSTLYWLSIVSGAVLYLGIVLCAPVIAVVFNEPQLQGVLTITGVSLVVIPWGNQYQYLFQKELQFKTIACAELVPRALGVVVALVMALQGRGVYAFVGSYLLYVSLKSAVLILAGLKMWRPRAVLRFNTVRSYIRFGLYQMGERTINFFSANVDYLIIGKCLGAVSLGYYKIAYELVTVPLKLINPIINNISFPVFAKRQKDDEAIRRGFLLALTAVVAVSVPLLVGCAAVAPLFIRVVYGEQWAPVAVVVQLLFVMGVFKAIGNCGGSVLLAKGRVDLGFKWNAIVAVGNLVVFSSIVSRGIVAIALAHAVLSVLYFLLSYRDYCYVTIRLPFFDYCRALALPLFMNAVMGLAVYTASLFLHRWITNPILLLIVLICGGAGVYITASVMAFRKEWSTLIGIITTQKK